MLGQDVLRDVSHGFRSQIPAHRRQLAIDADHRAGQAFAGGGVRVVALLAQCAATNGMVAADIDHGGILVRHNDDVMLLSLVGDHVVLRRADPGGHHGLMREIRLQGVLTGLRPAFLANRPAIDFVAASDGAVVARRGQDFSVLGWERDAVYRDMFHFFAHVHSPQARAVMAL